MLCIAGKNNIAINVANYVLEKMPYVDLVGMTNKNDSGIDGWQKSYKNFLLHKQIKEVEFEEIYDCEDLIFLSLEFDKIIQPKKFKSNKLYNIHFSLLPKYRGMYTSALPIIYNENETGVTLHYIDNSIDTGDIIAQKRFSIDFCDTAQDVYKKLIINGTKLVIEILPQLLNKDRYIKAKKQNCLKASYFSKYSINYNDLHINLNQCAISIYNQIRAFHFRCYQMPVINDMKIAECEILEQRSQKKPGTITIIDENRINVSTIDYDVVMYRDRFDELLFAIKANDVGLVKEIGKFKGYWNDFGFDGLTPLDLVLEQNNIEILYWLKTNNIVQL